MAMSKPLKSSFDLDLEQAIANSLELNGFNDNPPMLTSNNNFETLPSLYSRVSSSSNSFNSSQFLTSDYDNYKMSESPDFQNLPPIYSESLLNYRSPSLNDMPKVQKKEKSREELEISAKRRSKIEEVEEILRTIEVPREEARVIMEEQYKKYLEAKANFDMLDEYYNNYKIETESSTNIIEHQDILMDRGLLQDKYNISVNFEKSGERETSEASEPEKPRSIEERFNQMENIGTPVKLRVTFPDGRKGEYITGSMQTLGVITEYISEKYGTPLKLSKIPGVIMDSDTTLEKAGLTNTVALRFY